MSNLKSPRYDDRGMTFVTATKQLHKVGRDHLGEPFLNPTVIEDWFVLGPSTPLKAGISDLAMAIHNAKGNVGIGIGGHVIKTGCGPYLCDWLKRGVVRHVAMTGAAAIHDLELAILGRTSEDVEYGLVHGTFGMTWETHEHFAAAIHKIARGEMRGLGLSLAATVGDHFGTALPTGADTSVLAALDKFYSTGATSSVHVALGTDIVHMYPYLDAAALGKGSMGDFHLLVEKLAVISQGGVWLNIGSDVVLPEVFLKAIALLRNQGIDVSTMTTANFDFEAKYRPSKNVLERITTHAIPVIGPHEIMIPLLHALVAAHQDTTPEEHHGA